MKKVAAEPYREIDFSEAKRGPVIPVEPGKVKVSIRLDKAVVDYFRNIVEATGGGNYQTLINNALVAHIQQHSMLDAVRQVVREGLAGDKPDMRGELNIKVATPVPDESADAPDCTQRYPETRPIAP